MIVPSHPLPGHAKLAAQRKRVMKCMNALAKALESLQQHDALGAMTMFGLGVIERVGGCKECQRVVAKETAMIWTERIEGNPFTPPRCICDKANLH